MVAMRITTALLVVLACGNGPSSGPVSIGGFSVSVPKGWEQRTDARLQPGDVVLQPSDNPSITVTLSPFPEPLPSDPTEPRTCNLERSRPRVTAAGLIDTPAGRACAIEELRDNVHVSTRAIRAGSHGLLVVCVAAESTDACSAVFEAIRANVSLR
jgi:hypothetical protein